MIIRLLKNKRVIAFIFLICLVGDVIGQSSDYRLQNDLKPNAKLVSLGAQLFNDTSFSNPPGQSCASCHQADKAYTDGRIVAQGAKKGVFGPRNTPMLTYAKYALPFSKAQYSVKWSGGFFWDGRAKTLEEQALKPFFNPLEMNTTKAQLLAKLRTHYKTQFETLFGKESVKDDEQMIGAAAQAIASFERTSLFSPFTSKFDRLREGKAKFTDLEIQGERLFREEALCTECHIGTSADGRELFSDYVFHNITLPKNKQSEFLKQPNTVNPQGESFIDLGLANNANITKDKRPVAKGLFRTPSLRNVALTAPYMHNGIFSTLEDVINFYNENGGHLRKVSSPEVPENRSDLLSSGLDLNKKDIDAIIAFLHTLTDGYVNKDTNNNK